MGRDPNNFPEPNKFIPERFAAGGAFNESKSFAYIPFSAGPRNCIGQKYAMFETKSLLAKVMRNFHVSLAEDSLKEPVLSAAIILSPAQKINFYLTPRNSGS